MSASAVAVAASLPLARTSEGMKSGPIGLAIILLLCIACYFLFKSMSGHLRKVREDFPVDKPAGRPAVGGTPDGTAAQSGDVEMTQIPPGEQPPRTDQP